MGRNGQCNGQEWAMQWAGMGNAMGRNGQCNGQEWAMQWAEMGDAMGRKREYYYKCKDNI